MLTIAGLSIAATATAQSGNQTPENAKIFLQKVMASQKYLKNAFTRDDVQIDQQNEPASSQWVGSLTGVVTTSDRCMLEFSYNRPYFEIRTYGSNYKYWNANTSNVYLNFKTISEIKNVDSRVFISNPNWGVRPDVLHTSSPEMAARIAFAMNFLKSACNEADKTGF